MHVESLARFEERTQLTSVYKNNNESSDECQFVVRNIKDDSLLSIQ